MKIVNQIEIDDYIVIEGKEYHNYIKMDFLLEKKYLFMIKALI